MNVQDQFKIDWQITHPLQTFNFKKVQDDFALYQAGYVFGIKTASAQFDRNGGCKGFEDATGRPMPEQARAETTREKTRADREEDFI